MKNLFKYAASYWKAMIAIILILFVQAYCDLSLPAYTSDIVNVGIQQGGIEDEIPEQIAREEMDKLLLFVSEEDGQKVMDAYEEDTESYEKDAYVLKESVSGDEEQMKELQDILKLPMMMTAGFESGSDMTKEVESQLKSSLPDGTVSEDTTIFDIMKMLPGEQRTVMVEKMGEQMDDLPDTILDQLLQIGLSGSGHGHGKDSDRISCKDRGNDDCTGIPRNGSKCTGRIPGFKSRCVSRT